jgi:hypothetical protein
VRQAAILVGLTAAAIVVSFAAAASVPASKLAIMVLPKAALGPAGSSLRLDRSSSGVQDNAASADDSIDPHDTASSLARAGRITGYELGYSDPSLAALQRGAGLLEIDTEVDLYTQPSAVSAAMAKDLSDFRRYEGKVVDGVKLRKVEAFDVPRLGDAVFGRRLALSFNGKRVWVTGVEFRLGALEGSAVVTRADGSDVSRQTIALAQALEGRMRGVLAGTVSGTPVPIPGGAAPAKPPATRPKGAPDLSRAVLGTSDLPAGTRTTRSEYVRNKDAVATYEREFDLSGKLAGGSRLLSLESDVSLYKSDGDASVFVVAVESILGNAGSGTWHDFFVQKFQEGAGFKLTSVHLVRNRRLPYGSDARDITVRLGTPLGTFDASFVFMRVGRLVGSIYAVTLPGNHISSADVVQLERRAVQKMQSVPRS